MNKLSKLGQRERILIGIVLLALEIAAFYHFLIKPQLNNIRTRQTELSGREQLLEAKRSKLKLLSQLEKERRLLRSQVHGFRKRFFSPSDVHDFMKRIIQYADENDSKLILVDYKQRGNTKRRGMTLDFARTNGRNDSSNKKSKEKGATDDEDKNISVQPMELVIRGNYANLITILSKLENYEKLTSIRDLKIDYSRDEQDKLEINITLELHLINDNGKELSAPNSSMLSETRRSETPLRNL